MSIERQRPGPTVRRLLLGTQLRRLRQEAGLTRDEAARAIRAHGSKITRMERGQVRCQARDVADLLTCYRLADTQHHQALLELARRAGEPGWWQTYSDILPEWLTAYVDLEEAATRIRTYEVQFIPGLLQTPGYARAVIAGGRPGAGTHEVERRIDVRMNRAEVLTHPDAPLLWAVVDEAALYRQVGPPDVMRAQLEHLLAVSRQPNIQIQIMPFGRGVHPAEAGAFSLLRFPHSDLPDVAYFEQLTRGFYVDAPEEVATYTAAMEQLCVVADPPGQKSRNRIIKIINETCGQTQSAQPS